MRRGPPFRFVLTVPDLPEASSPALLRVSGVPVALRLLASAVRAGATELWLAGPGHRARALGARVIGDVRLRGVRLRVGAPSHPRSGLRATPHGSHPPTAHRDALPIIAARADVEVSAAAFEALARADGPAFLPGAPGVTRDAHLGRPRPLFLGAAPDGIIALAVRDPAGARAAKRRIFRDLASPSASWVARRMNAPISKSLSYALVETGVSPALATAAHTLAGVLSALCFASGELGALLPAGLLFELASVLDGVDGEIARAKLLDSPRGAALDTLGDGVAYVAFAAGLSVGYAAHAADRGLPWADAVPAIGAALAGTAAALALGMAAYAARAGLGGSTSGVAADLVARLSSEGAGAAAAARAPLRALVALGRRALFSKVVAGLALLAWATGEGALYGALFFGVAAGVLAMAAAFAVGAWRVRASLGLAPAIDFDSGPSRLSTRHTSRARAAGGYNGQEGSEK